MKSDGRLARCPLKSTIGDALFAVLCGGGHNIRKILAHLRALLALIIAVILVTCRHHQSIRLDQVAFFTQFRFALMRALASSISFRMSAVRATFGGFPALIMA